MSLNDKLLQGAAAAAGGITPSENFKVVTYTGTGSAQSITGVGFQPDFVWLKNRSQNSYAPRIFDSSRGATKRLQSSTTAAESTDSTSLTSFDTDGFTLGSDNYVNNSGDNFVAWCWKANGGTTSSNTDGDITSTVQVNSDAGFSIVKWASSNYSQTIGHGLDSAPDLIIAKELDTARNWLVYSSALGNDNYLQLNVTNASSTPNAGRLEVSGTDKFICGTDGTNQIAYVFKNVENFSKFGSYVGTGDADNRPIIETGFEPAFVMIKSASTGGSTPYHWNIYDNKRNKTNPRNLILEADTSDADLTASTTYIDFLSNGFQIGPTTSGRNNGSGVTYIYMAFAADPDTEAPTLASSFNIETYTGTNAAQSITGLGFSPGMVWWKNRSSTNSHAVADIVRGANKYIHPDGTQAQNISNGTSEDCISFDTDGFSVGTVQNAGSINTSGGSIVAWAWKADDNEPTIFGGPAIAVYKFEDNANDVTGNFNGTANSITYATGNFNKAAVFNGSSSYVNLSNLGISGAAKVSVSAWINVDSLSSNQTIFQFGNEANKQRFGFAIDTNGSLYVEYYGRDVLTPTGVISTSTWYHVLVSYNGGSIETGSNTQIYVNGVAQTMSVSGSQTGSANLGDANYGIGYRRASSNQYFDGKIDQLRIYKGALEQVQVDELYAETVSDNDDLSLGGPPEILISANANAGFSIVKYDGTGVAGTKIPHGLSAAPDMVIVKALESTANSAWSVYHTAVGNTGALVLNTTAGTDTNVGYWNNTSPTSTTFTLGTYSVGNESEKDYIAYCFHSVSGYSKIGSYTGSSSTVTVTVGFQLDFLMIKRSNGNNDWIMYDTLRSGSTSMDDYLIPNSSSAEYTNTSLVVNVTSTGFTIASGLWAGMNEAGGEYIYWAVAKNVPSNTTLANSFKVKTYAGTSATHNVTGVGFSPDLVWLKERDGTDSHQLYDTLRGANNVIYSNGTNAQYSGSEFPSFDSDGFTLSNNSSNNESGKNYIAWCWKAGNTWQSNIDGTQASLVNANTANGFGVVKWTGDGSASATVGHGLSSKPDMVIVKDLTEAGGWNIAHVGLASNEGISLNSSAAAFTSMGNNGGITYGNLTATTFGFATGAVGVDSVNKSGNEYIAYCWHSVTGYSKFGTYSGTGSSQTITTGFQPDWILTKRTDATDNWRMYDSVRQNAQPFDEILYANLNNAEEDNTTFVSGTTSTGFTLGSGNGSNASGGTYIYMAFKMN